MEKRKMRKEVCRESHAGRWLAAALIVGLFFFAGWWLFGGSRPSQARQLCLDRISVMVDRIDELSAAWNQRNLPEAKKPAQDADAQKTQPKTTPQPPSTPRPAADANKVTKPSPPPEPDVDPKDQEQLRDLLRKIDGK
jgi:hypothetical protein